jgi:hypothetical protein
MPAWYGKFPKFKDAKSTEAKKHSDESPQTFESFDFSVPMDVDAFIAMVWAEMCRQEGNSQH